MAFNHPSSSKNNTGVTTNHHYATLPGPQPVHNGDSHKQEIPAKSMQFVTTNNASSNCSCSRPDQSFFRFSYKHEELRHPTNRYPTSASSTWCHPWGALILRAVLTNIYSTRLSWNRRYPSLENSTHSVSNKSRNSNITADLDTSIITISQQISTRDFPGKRYHYLPFGNSISVVNDCEQTFAKWYCW